MSEHTYKCECGATLSPFERCPNCEPTTKCLCDHEPTHPSEVWDGCPVHGNPETDDLQGDKPASGEWTPENISEKTGFVSATDDIARYTSLQEFVERICTTHNTALAAERVNMETLVDAVEFYADPENYHAILILPDRPSGAFADDFELEHGHPDYDRAMPGKTARAALAKLEETK